jgi:hypothetical protein
LLLSVFVVPLPCILASWDERPLLGLVVVGAFAMGAFAIDVSGTIFYWAKLRRKKYSTPRTHAADIFSTKALGLIP